MAACALGIGLVAALASPVLAEEGLPAPPETSRPVVKQVRRCTLYANELGFGARCAKRAKHGGVTWREWLHGRPFVACHHENVPDRVMLPPPPTTERPGRFALEHCLTDYDLDQADGGPKTRIEIGLVWVRDGEWLHAPWMDPLWDQTDSTYPTPWVETGPTRRPRVNVPTFFWLADAAARPIERVVSDGVDNVLMRAEPVQLTVHPGVNPDEDPVVCDQPTLAYNPSRSVDDQPSTCSSTWTRSSAHQTRGAYEATIHAHWRVTYQRLPDGPVRTLGTYDIASTQLIAVQDVQTVNR